MKTLFFLSALLLTVLGQSTDTPKTTPTSTCTNGKVYTTCGTMCPLTCENKDNPPMICPLACYIGCVCPSGMVQNGDGCVAPEQCPTTSATPSVSPIQSNSAEPVCQNGNVYTTCGSACPLTCENKDNPPSCIQECIEGCFCPNGMVSNGGTCVQPDNCPAVVTPSPSNTAEPVCQNGNMYTTCGSACPLTCENKDSPPTCIQECIEGCFCPNGMVSNGGTCVQPENCPVGKPAYCTLSVVPGPCRGSFPRFYYNPITRKCESFIYGGCGGNDNRFETAQACMDTCGDQVSATPSPTSSVDKPALCQLSAVPGLCKGYFPSFFYNSTSKKCESFVYGGCGGNDNRFESAQSCMDTCGDQVSTTQSTPSPTNTVTKFNAPYISPPLSCPEEDVSALGACVIESNCMDVLSGTQGGCTEGNLCCRTGCGGVLCHEGVLPSPLCTAVKAKAENESSGLLGAYVPQCDDDGTFTEVQCHEGMCWCVDIETGKAVGEPTGPGQYPQCSRSTTAVPVATDTATPTCTNGKVFEECGTMCPLTCENKDNPPLICPAACKIGCACPQGMVELGNGCVAPEQCPTAASSVVAQPSPTVEACTNGKVHTTCGTMCPLTCENKDNPPMICPLACVVGCVCPSGMVQLGDGCVAPEQCPVAASSVVAQPSPTVEACTNGKVHTTCGTMCPLTCENKDNPPMICPLACVVGCVCPSGKVQLGDGCVAPEQCPTTVSSAVAQPSPTAVADMPDHCSLPPVSGLCEAYMPRFFYNSTSKKCESFVYGGCGGNDNRFETKKACMDSCGGSSVSTPEPELLADAKYNAQGVCPSPDPDQMGVCVSQCTSDDTCEDWEKCCSNGCGHSCMETVDVPYYSPPLQCPETLLPICNFHFACSSHDECDEGKYCCSTGCGAMCMEGVEKTPRCTSIRDSVQSSGLIGAYIPQCEKDGNFSLLQCHGSTGKCWCVDSLSGKPLSSPVSAEQPDCEQLIKDNKCKGIECAWPYCGEDVQPIMDDDHCCPYCPADCTVGDETYPSGSSFKSSDGCNTCSCSNGMTMCTLMACIPQCTYNGKHYQSGERFDATDGCNTCVCDENGVACTEMACLSSCKAGGVEMSEGEVRSDGCSECVCKDRHISCTLSEKGCANPVTRSVDITMKFNGDFDVVSQDMEGFKVSFKNSLVVKYESMSLQESQITDVSVRRGSVIVKATLEDSVNADGEETQSNTANITLLIIQLEQDYNNNDLTIQHQGVTLEPSGEFSYEENDDDDSFFFWSYVIVCVVLVVTLILLSVAIIGIIVMMKRNRRLGRRIPVPTKDSFENNKGFSNPMYTKT